MKPISNSDYNQLQSSFEVLDNPTAGKIGEVDDQDTIKVKKDVKSFDQGVVTKYSSGDTVSFQINTFQKSLQDYAKMQRQAVFAETVKPNGNWVDGYTTGSSDNRLHFVTTKNYVEPMQNPDDGTYKASRPLVVLVHGFPSNWTSWREQIDYLDGLGYNVVALDTRGINASEKVDQDKAYNTGSLATDIQSVIENLHYQSAFVVGHDWGAGETETLAILNQVLMMQGKPSILEGIAMLSVPHPKVVYDLMDDPILKSYNSLVDNIFLQGPVTAQIFKIPTLFKKAYADSRTKPIKTDPINAESISYARRPFNYEEFRYYEDNLESMGKRQHQDVDPKTDIYPKITIPALRIWGKDDKILGPLFHTQEFQQAEERYYTDIQDEEIAGGHWVHEQNYQEVNRLLGDFLKKYTEE